MPEASGWSADHASTISYDLTAGYLYVHTFYVVAGSAPVLVYNINSDECDLAGMANDDLSPAGSVVRSNVSEYSGGATQGIFGVNGVDVPLRSGVEGPGQWFHEGENFTGGPGSGRTYATTHVEGHAAGVMQQFPDITDADLYINRDTGPCAAAGFCRFVLNELLPDRATLRVHFPNPAGGKSIWQFQGGVPRWTVLQ